MRRALIIFGILLFMIPSASAIFYFDSFDRADSNTVGNNWTETNDATGTALYIENNTFVNNDYLSGALNTDRPAMNRVVSGNYFKTSDVYFTINVSKSGDYFLFLGNRVGGTTTMEIGIAETNGVLCSDGNLKLCYYNAGGWQTVQGLNTNQRYLVSFRNVDYVNQQYDIYVDNTAILTDVDFLDGAATYTDRWSTGTDKAGTIRVQIDYIADMHEASDPCAYAGGDWIIDGIECRITEDVNLDAGATLFVKNGGKLLVDSGVVVS